jgi:hypothetical protein
MATDGESTPKKIRKMIEKFTDEEPDIPGVKAYR